MAAHEPVFHCYQCKTSAEVSNIDAEGVTLACAYCGIILRITVTALQRALTKPGSTFEEQAQQRILVESLKNGMLSNAGRHLLAQMNDLIWGFRVPVD